jgi:hypothetical protein
MQSNFFIKYRGTDKQDDSQVDLVALGESIIGFDTVIREVFKVSKIKGDISVSASKTSEGSLVVDVVIALAEASKHIPFENIVDFLNFLCVVNQEVYTQANDFFNALGEAHESINEFAREYPATYDLVKTGITLFIGILIGRAGKHKKSPNLDDLPKPYAMALHKMIKTKKFKKALKPFIENEVVSISVSSDKKFTPQKTAEINSDNFENYLSEDEEKVLPDYENGKSYIFTGTIVGIQCSHGDSMKIRIYGFPRKYRDIVAYPPMEKTTENYRSFYGKDKNIVLKAMVERKSMYQKPRLHIQEMNLQNEPLLFDNENKNEK